VLESNKSDYQSNLVSNCAYLMTIRTKINRNQHLQELSLLANSVLRNQTIVYLVFLYDVLMLLNHLIVSWTRYLMAAAEINFHLTKDRSKWFCKLYCCYHQAVPGTRLLRLRRRADPWALSPNTSSARGKGIRRRFAVLSARSCRLYCRVVRRERPSFRSDIASIFRVKY
jgi:hypothetical protein